MTRVKICGLTSLEDALTAQESGADAVGFVFYPKSPRYILPEAARQIINRLNKKIKKIGVFVNSKPETVRRIANLLGLDMLQFHGRESSQYCQKFQDYKVIKAFRVKDSSSLKGISNYKTDYYLFDTFGKDSFGGSGKSFCWGLLKGLKIDRPFFLSGGLNVLNVRRAIKEVCPDWVDVSSGIEKSAGIKDKPKLKAFITKVSLG